MREIMQVADIIAIIQSTPLTSINGPLAQLVRAVDS